MILNQNNNEFLNRTQFDEQTQKVAKTIALLANGLALKQFMDAIDIAIQDVIYYSCLSIQPAQTLNGEQ